MTSEDESDGEPSNSKSPDATPIMMTRSLVPKRFLTCELPCKTNTSCAAARVDGVHATMDSVNNGSAATGAACMSSAKMISQLPSKIIKDCVYVMLNRIIHRMLQEVCNGCEVDHPSQRQHRCLFESPAAFYTYNSKRVKSRLYQTRMMQVLTHICLATGVIPLTLRMLGSVDMILWQLEADEEDDYHIDAPYDYIDADTAALITPAMETCW